MIRFVTCASFAAFSLVASFASADPRSSVSLSASPAQSGIPDPSAPVCAPSCRDGYTCVQGACVSACNPGCAANEQCTADGQCVAKMTPKPAALPAPAPVSTASDADTAPVTTAKPGVHLHDGFYMRLALGPALVSSTWKGGTDDATVSGMGPALEVSFGGTLGHGLVLGGGSFGSFATSPTLAYKGASTETGTASMSLIAPFVDWYPSPTDGFHFQGAIGVSYASFSPKNGGSSVSGTGLGFMAGAGYEIWVAEQWSVGALFRLTYATPSIKADGMTGSVDTTSVIPAVLVGATYH